MKVEYRDASFRYADDLPLAVKKINLEIPSGTSLALVGFSGSGKTTLSELLARSYDPTEGSVMVDGVPLDQWGYTFYRQNILAVVSQDTQLFNRSVRDNIRVVRPNVSNLDVEEAARRAFAHDFILNLRDSAGRVGYSAWIGENGISLSGGQRQRLAIARALLCGARVLVLDEATSALDAQAQLEVQKDIELLLSQRICTVLLIAHRMSTIQCADRIAVIDDGQVVELGSHEQLVLRNGLYSRLRELEFAGGFN